MNPKILTAVPVMAFLTVLMVRGMSGPPNPDNQAAATASAPMHDPSPSTSSPSTPYFSMAKTAFEGTRGIVNARGVELFRRAQQEPEAIAWIDQHCRAVAGDVAYLQKTFGTVTGEASQFSEFLNRSAELAACNLARHWLETGGIAVDALPGVNPTDILNKYQEVYPSGQQQPESEPPAEG